MIEEIHELAGAIGYFLIGLHSAAAVFHHYIKHDSTLARMLPARRAALHSAPVACVKSYR